MFKLESSIKKAEARLPDRPRKRKKRSDCGTFRINPSARAILDQLISTQERPRTRELLADLRARCAEAGVAAPSRATVYNYLADGPVRNVSVSDIPAAARAALYNLPEVETVPGHQLVFYCVNYGDLAAICYAAGRPWLDIYRAQRMRGFRPKSRGLLAAVVRARRL